MTSELDRLRERSRKNLRLRALSRGAFRMDRAQNPEPYRERVKRFLVGLPIVGALGATIPLFLLGPDFICLGLAPLAAHLAIGSQVNRLTYFYRVRDGETVLQQHPEKADELLAEIPKEIEG